MYMYRYWGFGFMFFMMLFCILFIALIAYIVSRSVNRQNASASRNQAFGILEERLAKGEIDEEEYKRKSDLLKNR